MERFYPPSLSTELVINNDKIIAVTVRNQNESYNIEPFAVIYDNNLLLYMQKLYNEHKSKNSTSHTFQNNAPTQEQ